MKTIESLLISKGDLDRIYVGRLKLFLWRSLHNSVNVMNPLYPDFEERQIRSGVLRVADVETIANSNGMEMVLSKLGKGTSLFDRHGAFGERNWTYFEIPEGTEIPSGLIITKDSYNKRFNATHYSISPNYDMPKIKFLMLLDQLAKNADVQKKQSSHG
ncbi:MAG: hypothetical protein COC05_05365 [Gammaproteobacteria bacterium]|nr:MAG: hypothetical protein COC05_05365 [Gammaproteobacteria bacterium]